MKKYLLLVYFMILSNIIFAQVNYNMQDLTVYECEGILKDSESNSLNPSWYSHDENFNFTICPPNVFRLLLHLVFFLQKLLMII